MTGTPADLAGRTFFVTGANSGIGRAMVEAIAARGGAVVLAARSEERVRPVLDAIRQAHPAADVRSVLFDVSSLASLRRAAEDFLAGGGSLDVLVNNAGVAGTRALSADGFDLTYATNYIGPFALTNLLLPKLRESRQGRIVNVSSVAHLRVKAVDWSGLEVRSAPTRSAFPEYAVTKLMNVLHARELARRFTGTTLTTSSCHPGAVASNIWRAVPEPLQWFMKLFMSSNEEGAKTPLYCATAPELAGVTGRYYDKCRAVTPAPLARDPALAEELWSRTEAAIARASPP